MAEIDFTAWDDQETKPHGAVAQIVPFPNAAPSPMLRQPWRGRYPSGVLSLNVERKRRRIVSMDIDHCSSEIVDVERAVSSLRSTLEFTLGRLHVLRARQLQLQAFMQNGVGKLPRTRP